MYVVGTERDKGGYDMGLAIMIAGIILMLAIVAVYAVRVLAKEDTEDDDDGGN